MAAEMDSGSFRLAGHRVSCPDTIFCHTPFVSLIVCILITYRFSSTVRFIVAYGAVSTGFVVVDDSIADEGCVVDCPLVPYGSIPELGKHLRYSYAFTPSG
jgi:hypothetical protein